MTKEEDIELLQEGLRRIRNGWIKCAFVRTEQGRRSYCAVGALHTQSKVLQSPLTTTIKDTLKYIATLLVPALPNEWRVKTENYEPTSYINIVYNFNDDLQTTQADIIQLYERAIALRQANP